MRNKNELNAESEIRSADSIPQSTTPQSISLALSDGGETARLRLFFLAPLTLVIMVAVGLFVFKFYRDQQEDVKSGVVPLSHFREARDFLLVAPYLA